MSGVLAELRDAARAVGLSLRGALTLTEDERTGPLAGARSLALLGFVGSREWPVFAASPEASDGVPQGLDRWSRRVVTALGETFGAAPLFPFDGPPYYPFQSWAWRAEALFPSPLGLLIHPQYGLWHSYRGALALAEEVESPPEAAPNPCDACAAKPCLRTCPVGAFTHRGYDVGACAAFLRGERGGACLSGGCLARRACPVGPEFAQTAEQAAFHLRAFLAARD